MELKVKKKFLVSEKNVSELIALKKRIAVISSQCVTKQS